MSASLMQTISSRAVLLSTPLQYGPSNTSLSAAAIALIVVFGAFVLVSLTICLCSTRKLRGNDGSYNRARGDREGFDPRPDNSNASNLQSRNQNVFNPTRGNPDTSDNQTSNQCFAGLSIILTPSAYEYSVAEEQRLYVEDLSPMGPPSYTETLYTNGDSGSHQHLDTDFLLANSWPASPGYSETDTDYIPSPSLTNTNCPYSPSLYSEAPQTSALTPPPLVYTSPEHRRGNYREG